MKVLIFLNLFCVSFFASAKDLKSVDFIDVSRYLGRWYQQSHNPLRYEPDDCTCNQQTLGLTQDDKVSVFNSCNDKTPQGPLLEIRGYATSNDTKSNSQFTVDFGLPHTGQYWIIGIDPDYRWAVVSDPSFLSLYILSKTPELDPELYKVALAKAAEQVDTSKLKTTLQMGCQYPN